LLAIVVCSASCIEIFSKANNRAFSTVVVLRSMATVRATLFQTNQTVVGVLTFAQSCATFVWSAVRVVLLAAPSSLTSLKEAAYSSLVKAGGGFGAN
jgi:5-formaminoimidazole-4-carboxamide-1-beta-D-ribofuranosyl 5'-monophosphate synthetase